MAAPTIVGVGAVASGMGAITPPFPVEALADGDILITELESVGNEAYFGGGAPPTGWAHVTGSPVNVDTSTRLTVIWKRFVTGDTAPDVGDSGNHNVGRMIAIRGVKASGDPWNVTPATAQETAANTSAEFPSVTTAVIDCLIVYCIATGRDAAVTNNLGALTGGTGLTSITERVDNWVSLGTGGGIGMVTAIKAAAGATGVPTATMSSSDAKATMTIALEPSTGAAVSAAAALSGTGTLTAGAGVERFAAATLSGTGTITAAVALGPVRQFDGTDDNIRFPATGFTTITQSAFSIAALFRKPDTDTAAAPIWFANAAAPGTFRMLMFASGTGWNLYLESGVEGFGAADPPDDVWVLAIITKPAGTAFARLHTYNYATTTQAHTNTNNAIAAGALTADSVYLGGQSGNFLDGYMAAAGVWTRELSDAECNGMIATLQSWAALNPVWLVRLNQASAGTAVEDLIGSNDQNAITGTTAVTTTEPAPFDFTVSVGPQIEATLAGTGTITAGVTLEARAAVTLAGTGTLAAAAAVTRFAAVTLAGTGSITATAVRGAVGAVTLSGTGTITAAVRLAPALAAVILAGTGTITAAAVVGSVAILAGVGTITAAVVAVRFAAATLAGTGTITAAVVAVRLAAATLSGTGTITAAAALIQFVAVTLSGTGTISAETLVARVIIATLTGTGTIVAEAGIGPLMTRGRVGSQYRAGPSISGRIRQTSGVASPHRITSGVSGGGG